MCMNARAVRVAALILCVMAILSLAGCGFRQVGQGTTAATESDLSQPAGQQPQGPRETAAPEPVVPDATEPPVVSTKPPETQEQTYISVPLFGDELSVDVPYRDYERILVRPDEESGVTYVCDAGAGDDGVLFQVMRTDSYASVFVDMLVGTPDGKVDLIGVGPDNEYYLLQVRSGNSEYRSWVNDNLCTRIQERNPSVVKMDASFPPLQVNPPATDWHGTYFITVRNGDHGDIVVPMSDKCDDGYFIDPRVFADGNPYSGVASDMEGFCICYGKYLTSAETNAVYGGVMEGLQQFYWTDREDGGVASDTFSAPENRYMVGVAEDGMYLFSFLTPSAEHYIGFKIDSPEDWDAFRSNNPGLTITDEVGEDKT